MLSRNQLKVGEGERDNDRGVMQRFFLRVKSSFLERRGTRVTSKRLMIMRLENIQVGKGQYLYQTVR